MSVSEIDSFRAELLRQKIIFEAELRRQREVYDQRLSVVSQELADREADCRNLQSVVTILGKKLDILSDQYHQQFQHRTNTPRRAATPTRYLDRESVTNELKELRTSVRANSARRASPLISIRTSDHLPLNRVPSLTTISKSSRTNSPACPSTVHSHRPHLTSSNISTFSNTDSTSPKSPTADSSNNISNNRIISNNSYSNSGDNVNNKYTSTNPAAMTNTSIAGIDRSARIRERFNGRRNEKMELAPKRLSSINSNNDDW